TPPRPEGASARAPGVPRARIAGRCRVRSLRGAGEPRNPRRRACRKNPRRDADWTLMSLTLYAHPFSSYCQKVLIALYETGAPFTMRRLEHSDAAAMA